MRAPPLPARPSGFAARYVHVIDIADLTDRRVTGLMNAPDFAGRHFYQTVTAFAVIQRRLLAGAARDLAAASRRQFDIVNVRAQRYGGQGKGISQIWRRLVPRHNPRPNPQTVRCQDIT